MDTETRNQFAGDIKASRQQRDALRNQAEARRQRFGDTLLNKVGVFGSEQSDAAADAEHRNASLILEEAKAVRALAGEDAGYIPSFEEPNGTREAFTATLAINPVHVGSIPDKDPSVRSTIDAVEAAAPDIRNGMKTTEGFLRTVSGINEVIRSEESGWMEKHRTKSDTIIQEHELPVPRQPKGEHGRLTRAMLLLIEDNIDIVKAGIQTNEALVLENRGSYRRMLSHEAMRSVMHLLIMGDATQIRLANAVIKQDLDRYLMIAESGDFYTVKQILLFGDSELREATEKNILLNVENKTYPLTIVRALLQVCLDDLAPEHVQKLAHTIVEMTVSRAGFTLDKLKAIWEEGASQGDAENTLYPSHVSSLYALEQVRPGAARRLYEQFGLAQFNRYPTEAMVNQDTAADSDVPYGVIITARHDQGVFASPISNSGKIIDQIIAQLAGKLQVRLLEVGGRAGLVGRHAQLDARYGDKEKIAFGVHIVHGQVDSMRYGKDKVEGVVTMADLDTPEAKAVLAAYKPKAQHVLISCLTGASGGIGQKLSERSGNKVLAPKISIKLPDIQISFDAEGNPDFEVVYPHENIKAEYVAGQSV